MPFVVSCVGAVGSSRGCRLASVSTWMRASAASARAVGLVARRAVGEHVGRALGAVGERQDAPADGDEDLRVVDARRPRAPRRARATARTTPGPRDEELRDRAAVRARRRAPWRSSARVAERDAEEAVVEVDAAREPRHVGVEAAAEARRRLEEEAAARAERDLRVARAAHVPERGGATARLVDDARLVVAARGPTGTTSAIMTPSGLSAGHGDALGDAVADEPPVLDPAVDRVLAALEPRLDDDERQAGARPSGRAPPRTARASSPRRSRRERRRAAPTRATA